MVDRNEKCLSELLKLPGNNVCADCGAKGCDIYPIISIKTVLKGMLSMP